jgi:hypothetical protein
MRSTPGIDLDPRLAVVCFATRKRSITSYQSLEVARRLMKGRANAISMSRQHLATTTPEPRCHKSYGRAQ